MKLIEENPFRILGIVSNASAKEVMQSETYIVRYSEIGKSAELKFDVSPPLKVLDRTQDLVSLAKNQIHTNFDRMCHAIFWFVNGSSIDKIALAKLTESKDLLKASDTFLKGSRNFVASKDNFTSILNFSTIELLSYPEHKDEERVKKAIRYKYEVINEKSVFKFLEILISSTSGKVDHNLFIKRYFNNVKQLLTEVFPRKNQNNLLLDIFSDNKKITEEITSEVVNSLVKTINKKLITFDSFFEAQSKKTDSQIVKAKSTIITHSKNLVKETKADFNQLKKILKKDNFQFSNLLNELYERVNLAVIMCYNKEMDKLNRAVENRSYSVINSISFQSYVSVLKEASKAIGPVSCSIKSTLNNNLEIIKKTNQQLLNLKVQTGYSSPSSSSTRPNRNYQNSSSDSSSFGIGLLIVLGMGGGCAAITGEPEGFWIGAGMGLLGVLRAVISK